VVVSDHRFLRRNVAILQEAQVALNIAFGAILSAYIGNSLAEIDNRPFDHVLGLCLGNSFILRGEYRVGSLFLTVALVAAVFAHTEGRTLGFEVVILRLLSVCWFVALLGSDAVLTVINYIHHRNRT
jgi:hypothetical protein